jgi:hypothetical protein
MKHVSLGKVKRVTAMIAVRLKKLLILGRIGHCTCMGSRETA